MPQSSTEVPPLFPGPDRLLLELLRSLNASYSHGFCSNQGGLIGASPEGYARILRLELICHPRKARENMWAASASLAGMKAKNPSIPRLQAARHGKIYQNAVPTTVSPPSGYGALLKRWLFEKAEREPKAPLGPFPADATALAAPVPAAALRATWLGHSSMLLEIDGRRFLTDPVWSERASPSQLVGPKRFFAPPLPLAKLPKLDAVILSHDHYDHLDSAAIRVLGRTGVPFFCPLGVGAHLRRWGVPTANITELSWWETAPLGDDFTLAATPARHFSGRGLTRNDTLWASWCLLGPTHKVFFGGDSGPFAEGFRQIGEAYGPFDLTMLEIGASDPEWADIHMGPDQALAAHQLLGGGPLLPLHWGTFNLAFHAWRQPVQRLLEAAGSEVPLLLPAPGQWVDVAAGPLNSRWWER